MSPEKRVGRNIRLMGAGIIGRFLALSNNSVAAAKLECYDAGWPFRIKAIEHVAHAL
jgi:hypothetical protein